MSPPAAQLLCELCFVCVRPILTNVFSVEHFCPLNIGFNRALIKLSIGDNALGHGTQAICESLCHNDTLQSISFANLAGSDEFKVGAAGAKHVADMLKVNRALTGLCLWGNGVGAGGAWAIADSLPQS